MARNVFALALLTALALSGCSKLDTLDKLPFLGNKKAKAAEAHAAALRARTESLRKARRIADSIAVVRHAACVDSVRAELSKPALATKKIKRKGKKQSPAPSPELIATQAQTLCEQREAAGPAAVATKAAQPDDSAKTAASRVSKDTASRVAARDTTAKETPARAAVKDTAVRANAKPTTAPGDLAVQQATDQSAWADSVRKAKETEMSRETFAYSGGTRDPFASLLDMAKAGPEIADLQLVGIYRNMRRSSGSVAVFRERAGGKRHRLRAGDQLGRSRLLQIRERDVVFMIEDFGFERQETLSLRKQEDVTP
ncbi:MAG TPA: hypothetical protein VFS51_13040 [Gemmatimonadales bacterium]|nr:hypothetical protein [Gemmatimonadales bacterium]